MSIFAALLILAGAASSQPVAPGDRGRYLATAGNCVSCHTQPGAAPFSGGVGFETPFGTIFSTNITPDADTGIGRWSAGDMRRAMHEGIASGGYHLFPAFPYTSFTKVSDGDVEAIYAYLRSLKPVRYSPPGNDWLLRMRWPMAIWNAAFFDAGRFSPDVRQTAEWNRGAYLVEGLAHCGACHTPRNIFMAEIPSRAYAGGSMRGAVAPGKHRRWSAINLTSSKTGLGSWSMADLTKYLSSGFSPRGGTFGPMNEVILNSLSHLSAADIHAMALYLKSLPPLEHDGEPVSADQAAPGASVYKARCEKCHSASGRGGMFSGPPVAGSAIVQAPDPASLINVILYGADAPASVSMGAWETMPSYDDVLDDSEVAALSNYLRGTWGNRAGAVSTADVARQR